MNSIDYLNIINLDSILFYLFLQTCVTIKSLILDAMELITADTTCKHKQDGKTTEQLLLRVFASGKKEMAK